MSVPGAAPVLMSSATMALNTTDEDGDLIPAYWEIQYFGGPTNATGYADSDRDGVTDYAEYVALSIPTNSASVFAITSAEFQPGAKGTAGAVPFTSHVARVYQLQFTTNLAAPGAWSDITAPAAGLDGPTVYVHTNATDSGFYRVKVNLPQ